jgi:NAD(P)H dehydrogenase (quinone)
LTVRALVHQEDERAEWLRSLGANVVSANLLDLDDTRAALDRVITFREPT